MADCTVNVSAFSVVSTQLPRAMAYLSPKSFVTTVNAVTFGAGAVDATVNLSAFAAATTPKAVTPAVDIAPASAALTATQNAVTVLAGTEATLTTLSHLSTMQAPTVEIPTVANVTGWAVWSTPLSVTVSTSGNATVDLGALSLVCSMPAVTVSAEINERPAANDSSLRYAVVRPTYRELVTERRVASSIAVASDRAGKPKAVGTDSNVLRRNVAMSARAQGSRVGTVSRTSRTL